MEKPSGLGALSGKKSQIALMTSYSSISFIKCSFSLAEIMLGIYYRRDWVASTLIGPALV